MSNPTPDTISKFSLNAAADFLRTAVYIDERRMDLTPNPYPAEVVEPPPSRPGTEPVAPVQELPTAPTLNEIDPQELVRGFASKHIVCATFRINPNEVAGNGGDPEAMMSICQASDIVIIDFNLEEMHGGVSGNRCLSIIKDLSINTLKDSPPAPQSCNHLHKRRGFRRYNKQSPWHNGCSVQ